MHVPWNLCLSSAEHSVLRTPGNCAHWRFIDILLMKNGGINVGDPVGCSVTASTNTASSHLLSRPARYK